MGKHQLYQAFLEEWPVERVQNMTLSEYTNLNRADSFCYWIEFKTNELGGIRGGSSYKFGIFEKANKSDSYSRKSGNILNDDHYAWYSKYGENKDDVFKTIHKYILQTIDFTQKGEFEKIDEIDLGHVVKWKIAFLYSDYKLF